VARLEPCLQKFAAPRSRKVQGRSFFYVWDEKQSVMRWMCSFDTAEEDVTQFAKMTAVSVQD
jgi:threonine aldolase